MERRCPRNTKRSNPDSVPAILSWCLAINSCMGVFLRIVVGLGTTCNDTQTGNARNASGQPALVGFKGLQRRVYASAKADCQLLTAERSRQCLVVAMPRYERRCQEKKLLPAPREGAGVVTYIQPHLILRGVIGLVALARKGLVVEHDAAATASHILTHQTLFRLGVASSLASTGFYLTLVALFYEFFRPVNRSNSLLAAFFGLLGCAIQAGGSVFQVFSLVVLRTGQG